MPRLRPRMSLLTAFLLMTIIGMGIAIIQLYREVEPLRAEVRQSRVELGRLTIEDPNKVHVISVRTQEPNTWKWRIYLPPGGSYQDFCYWGKKMPSNNKHQGRTWFDQAQINSSGMTSTIGNEGEFTIEAKLLQEGNRWVISYFSNRGGVRCKMSIDDSFNEWLSDNRGTWMTSNVPSNVQKVLNPGEPILLLSILKPVFTERPGKPRSWSKQMLGGPAEGIAFWIEQDPPLPPP